MIVLYPFSLLASVMALKRGRKNVKKERSGEKRMHYKKKKLLAAIVLHILRKYSIVIESIQ